MKIPKHIIDKILETADIVEVVGEFVDLKKKGVRYTGLCPFHDDHNDGNFIVHPVKQCYKCFTCGAKGGVVDFLMNHEKLSYPDAIRYLGKKYNIETDMTDFNYTPPPPRPKPEPLPMLELPKHIMAGTLTEESLKDDNLVTYLRTAIKWDAIQRKRVDEMIGLYNVGHGRNGHTIFWQLDEQGRLRTGKMMKYYPPGHPKFGHRDKESSWSFDWIHSALSRTKKIYDDDGNYIGEGPLPFPQLYDPSKQEAQITFFGLHLLDKWKRKGIGQDVCIVESEKTALILAVAYGNHAKQLWIACGGLEMLKRERLKPLIDQGRRIILYPDRDGIEKWRIKAEQLHYDRLTIDTTPVTKWWNPCDGEKADYADVVVRMINESKELKTIDDVKEAMPETKPLIEKFNLEIDNEHRKSTDEG